MKLALFFLSLILVFGLSEAAILSVATGGSQPYTQVQPAINAATAGDTIMVFPGAYNGFIVDRKLVIIGAGTNTTGEGTKIAEAVEVNDGADGTELRSLWIQTFANSVADSASSPLVIHSDATNILIWRCFMENTNNTGNRAMRCAWTGDGTSTQWVQCTFWTSGSDYGIGLGIGNNSSAALTSCVIADISGGVWGPSSSTAIARHCIMYGPGGFGPFSDQMSGSAQNCAFFGGGYVTFGSMPRLDYGYCAADANFPYFTTTNFLAPIASLQNLTVNPRACDFHLSSASVLRDAGNPNDPPDLDNSRADVGIYGGQHPFVDGGIPDYPFVIRLEAPYSVPQNGVMKIWARGQVGPGY